MGMWIPIIVLHLLATIGCPCGLYLLYIWLVHQTTGELSGAWRNVWRMGWLVLPVGYVMSILPPPYGWGFLLLYVGPALWIIALVLLLRSEASKPLSSTPTNAL